MKGQGNIMIGMIFFSILIVAITPLILHAYGVYTDRRIVYEQPIYNVFTLMMRTISGDFAVFFNASSLELEVVNKGGKDLHIEKYIIYATCGNKEMYISVNASKLIPSGRSTYLRINIDSRICRNPLPRTVYLISRDGVVISSTVITVQELRELTKPPNIANPEADITHSIIALPIKISGNDPIHNITLTLQGKGFSIYTLDNMDRPSRLVSYTNIGSSGMKGGTTSTYIWRLDRTYTNTDIEINGQTIRNLWIGYDPRNLTKYNMIITADSISINVPRVSYSSYVRIKIYGFRPRTSEGILRLGTGWITKPSQDVADYTFNNSALTLRGSAERIEIYVRSSGVESSYNPYTMFINTDGVSKHASGILFTSIDRVWGFYNTRNENHDNLLDYSTRSLALVFKELEISNKYYSGVYIAINYRFHDNEGSDAEGTSVDKPIMFVGLVDENNVVYSYRSYTFRELTRYEDTSPPTAQAQSSIIFIPLPPGGISEKKFYVFIAIQDPYHYNGNLDDLDFTLYIESLSVMPYS